MYCTSQANFTEIYSSYFRDHNKKLIMVIHVRKWNLFIGSVIGIMYLTNHKKNLLDVGNLNSTLYYIKVNVHSWSNASSFLIRICLSYSVFTNLENNILSSVKLEIGRSMLQPYVCLQPYACFSGVPEYSGTNLLVSVQCYLVSVQRTVIHLDQALLQGLHSRLYVCSSA